MDTRSHAGSRLTRHCAHPNHGGDLLRASFNGSGIFTYTLNGGSPATVNVTVGAVDDAPIAFVDTATVGEDSAATVIDVLANDIDIDGGPKTIAAITQPGHGTVAITGGGTGLTFTPDANFNGRTSSPTR